MSRILLIDNLRGVAFIFMLIQHTFYFYDVSTIYSTSYSKNIFIELSGTIARSLFILLAGVSLTLSKSKSKKPRISKRINRSLEILLHASIISSLTYLKYPDFYVRFGILHFIALTTFSLSFISSHDKLTIIIFIISLLYKPSNINTSIDTITGAIPHYNMMDWFPIFPWVSLLLLGMIIGQQLDISKIKTFKYLKKESLLTFLGRNSLELYTFHIILLILFYSSLNSQNKF